MKPLHQPLFYLHNILSPEQLNFFRQHGYVHFKSFISKQSVKDFLKEIDRIQEHLIDNNIEKVNGVPLKFGQDVNGGLLIQRIAFASQYSSLLSDFLKDPRFKAILQLLWPYEGRIGEFEKDGLVVNHYVNTNTSAFTQLGWHTDSPRDLFLGNRI